MALLLTVAGFTFYTASAREPASTPEGYTPFTPPPEPEPRLNVTFVGDSYTAGSSEDSGPDALYPALISGALDANVATSAQGGAGYVPAEDGTSFATLAAAVPADSDVVVFFGSRNDAEGYDATYAGAVAAYEALRQVAPEAQIVAVGPPWVDDAPLPWVIEARDAVRDAAASASVTFVDPIAEGWLLGPDGLIGADETHPTDAGHAVLAERMTQALTATTPVLAAQN